MDSNRLPSSSSNSAPLVYLEIVGATALGYLVFGDVPGAVAASGIALVVLSGWLVARRPAG